MTEFFMEIGCEEIPAGYIEPALNSMNQELTAFFAKNRIQTDAGQITLPMLLLHGAADSMAAAEGSRFLHDRISSTDKTLKIYPDLYHEIFNEPEREQVLSDVLQWCDNRVAQS